MVSSEQLKLSLMSEKQLNKISPSYPFGAHAWFTYPENFDQWKKHIEELK